MIREVILAGRKAIEDARIKHEALHTEKWSRDFPDMHTPILEEQMSRLKDLGFVSQKAFFDASDLLSVQDLGFVSKEEFYLAKKTPEQKEQIVRMWK